MDRAIESHAARAQPMAILGTGRSGSTYLHSLLQSHPSIALTNEGKMLDFLDLSARFSRLPAYEWDASRRMQGMINRDYVAEFSLLYQRHARAALLEFYDRRFAHKAFTHFGDKMVSLESAATLLEWLPNVRVLLLARDPRDVVCSVRAGLRTPLGSRHRDALAGGKVEPLAERWRHTYEDALVALRGHYHLIDYAELVREPEREVAKALDWLGLPYAAECAQAVDGNATFSGHGNSPSPQQSIGRWRRELTAAEVAAVERTCGPLMRRLGFRLASA